MKFLILFIILFFTVFNINAQSANGGSFVVENVSISMRHVYNQTIEELTKNKKTKTIEVPFWMGQFEITQKQWMHIMQENPSEFIGDNRPVDNVCFDLAEEFCKKLTKIEQEANRLPEHFFYRLPTKEEWEKCAFTLNTPYSGHKNINRVAWYINNNGNEQTHEVGKKKGNCYCLYDMCGNVWEWTTASGTPVLKGGGWRSINKWCKVSFDETGHKSNVKRNDFGFRIVLAYNII